MLEHLLRGKTQRELFRLLWGQRVFASVSTLSRLAGVSFSAAHRELEAMGAAGLAVPERVGSELKYRRADDHPQALLLGRLANVDEGEGTNAREVRDAELRGQLASVGAPLAGPPTEAPGPPLEEVLADSLALSHRDATVARVLPAVLWQRRHDVDLDRLALEATRRDERHALGYFLELAGHLGGDSRLEEAARRLSDRRRRRPRMFFAGRHGPHELAATRRNTPPEALRWGYLMNLGLDSFRATFDKFAASP